MTEIWRATTEHETVDVEIVRGGSNKRARLTFTPERLDVKLGQETDVTFIVAAAALIAEALHDNPASFRGDFYRDGDRMDAKLRPTNRAESVRFEYDRTETLARVGVEELPEPIVEPVPSPKLVIPRGYQGAGKSDLYYKLRAENPLLGRVSRDSKRAEMFGDTGVLEYWQEQVITRIEREQATELLAEGCDVYIDALNLRPKWARAWADFAVQNGVNFEVIDLETDVDECVRRDKARGEAGGRSVGEDTIRDLARRFPRKQWPVITPSVDAGPELVPYVPDESLPPAWLFDIDGTLALMTGRDPYDLTRVHEDAPNEHVAHIARKLALDAAIIQLTGREDVCRDVTVAWMAQNAIPSTEMHMRRTGDGRPDYLAKYEMFGKVRDRYRILGVFDDRLSVVRMWDRLGVPFLRLGKPDHDDF